jgi:Trypsin
MDRLFLLVVWFQVATCFDGYQDRIVGGPDAEIDRFPYMASMHKTNTKKLICSGSIIGANWILTAAHCVRPVDEFRVRVGSSFVGHDGVVYTPAEFIPYPDFDLNGKYWLDIGLIRLESRIEYSPTVQPLRLAGRDTEFPFGTGCEFAGFGRTRVASVDAQERRLRFIGLPILQFDDCDQHDKFFKATMLCVGFNNVRAGACKVSFSKEVFNQF